MRVKDLGYKFVGMDREEVKLFKMATAQRAPNSCDKQMRDIILKKNIYFLQFKEMPLFLLLE